jgi:hypothetical protein
MKQIRIPLPDLILVLELMQQENQTKEVVICEHEGAPAIYDADDPDQIVMFMETPEELIQDDDDVLH